MPPRPDILVLGGGPAGCAAAAGLARMGYGVTLVAAPRPFASCEGISARTLAGLEGAGLHGAAATAGAASPRSVAWNGEYASANVEHLVLREPFDGALLDDAAAAGVRICRGRARRCRREAAGWTVAVEASGGQRVDLAARFLIEARGRSAPRSSGAVRGPESLCLLRRFATADPEAATHVLSFDRGWAWLARPGSGELYLQLCIDGGGGVPASDRLEAWFSEQLQRLPRLAGLLGDARPLGGVAARGATTLLQAQLVDADLIRIGDAAMAVDPLSGNGIFQALSSALVAPAVVNTLLAEPSAGALALDFYRGRVADVFWRFARLGRDFYRAETRWPAAGFWGPRRAWPDDLPAHGDGAAYHGIAERPVVDGDRIRSRRVALTGDRPLGVWRVAGVALAELLDDLPPPGPARDEALRRRVRRACGARPADRDAVAAWLSRYGLARPGIFS